MANLLPRSILFLFLCARLAAAQEPSLPFLRDLGGFSRQTRRLKDLWLLRAHNQATGPSDREGHAGSNHHPPGPRHPRP